MIIEEMYAKRGSFELLVNGISLDKGTILGLVGANGAGKTTFMEALAGYGRRHTRLKMDMQEEKEILYIPSYLEAYDYLTIREFIRMCVKYSHGKEDEEEALAEKLGLAGREKVLIGELSEGMRKRLNFVPMFLKNYTLVLLDEPFNSIDLDYVYQLKRMILEKKEDTIIIISSHILETLQDLCDSFLLLEQGRVKKLFSGQDNIRELEKLIFDTTA